MFKKYIGIDIDGVIGDSDKIFRKHINKHFDVNLKREDIVHFYYDKVMGIPEKQMKKFWDEFTEKRYWMDIPLLQSVKSSIDYLSEKYSILIITSRNNRLRDITEEWLNKNRIKHEKLILLERQENKLTRVLQENYDLSAIIEDRLDVAEAFSREGIKAILFNYQWNKNPKKDHKNIIRVNGWREVLHYL
ncbi:MAG: hypothetical protein KKH98_10455 [Spirochaetes bacterium]|nr:hypothetical protein [Spirochaetota bacterium]